MCSLSRGKEEEGRFEHGCGSTQLVQNSLSNKDRSNQVVLTLGLVGNRRGGNVQRDQEPLR